MKKSAGKIKYAVRKNAKIDVVESSDLATQFPESVIGFLEGQVHFSWPQHSESSRSNQMSNNHVVFISACTNQGGQGLKYLLSRNNEQFVRVANSADMVRVAPHLVVAFLESNLDLLECKAPQKTTVYSEYSFLILECLQYHSNCIKKFQILVHATSVSLIWV